ncbi:MAG TPA: glycosyltransferase [Candidatus Aenigmarchaeota archaeon]|nr:glycosyltransferase [Candidatus Aenigmarchaeota archaeon]
MEGNFVNNRSDSSDLLLPEVSVIIPAKNEPYLPFLIQKIRKVLKNPEILVQEEEGLGKAVRKGFEKARADKIIVMDGDGQHPPEKLPEIIKNLENFEMVICSRERDERSLFRRLITRIATWWVKKRFNLELKDPLSGYFGIRKSLLKNLKLETDGFKIGLEIILKAKPRVKEIPYTLEKRKMGRSKACLRELLNLMRISG